MEVELAEAASEAAEAAEAEAEPSDCVRGLPLFAAAAKVVEGAGAGNVRRLRYLCL